jgi:hypothetical protein
VVSRRDWTFGDKDGGATDVRQGTDPEARAGDGVYGLRKAPVRASSESHVTGLWQCRRRALATERWRATFRVSAGPKRGDTVRAAPDGRIRRGSTHSAGLASHKLEDSARRMQAIALARRYESRLVHFWPLAYLAAVAIRASPLRRYSISIRRICKVWIYLGLT